MRKKSIRKNKTNRKKTYRKKTNRKEKYHKKTNRRKSNLKKTKHKKTYLKKRNIQRGGEIMNDGEFEEFYKEFIEKGLSNYIGELEGSFTTLKQQVFSNPDKSVEQKVNAFEKLIQNLIDVLNGENYRTIIIFILQLVIEIVEEFEAEGKREILVEPLKRFFDSEQFQNLEISEKKGTELYRDITGYDYQGTAEVEEKHLESYMNDIVKGATMEFQDYEKVLAKIDEDNLEIKKDLLQRINNLIGLFEDYSLEEIESAAGDLTLQDALELFHNASQESMEKLKEETEETVETVRGTAREEVGNTIYQKMASLIMSLGITREEIDVVNADESENYWIEIIKNILKIIEEKIKRMQDENENARTSVEEAEHERDRTQKSLKKLIKARNEELDTAVSEAEEKGKKEGYEAEKINNEERLKEILESVNKLGSVTEGDSYSSKSDTEDIESTLENMAGVIEGKIKQQIKLGTAEATAAARQSLMQAADELQELRDTNKKLQAEANVARETRRKAIQGKDSALKSLKAEGIKNSELIARHQVVVEEQVNAKNLLREQNKLYESQNIEYRNDNTELREQNEKLTIELAEKEDCIEKTRQALGDGEEGGDEDDELE